jgi:hypothetical protein
MRFTETVMDVIILKKSNKLDMGLHWPALTVLLILVIPSIRVGLHVLVTFLSGFRFSLCLA